MGCCFSSSHQRENPNSGDDDHHDAPGTNADLLYYPQQRPTAGGTEPSQPPAKRTPLSHAFFKYTLSELMEATHGFARQYMISKGGGELPNFTYRGCLPGGHQIAVKRFSIFAWPDEKRFREKVRKAARLRHRWLVNLIGYCCDDDERLLVAEFMPNDSLATHLFKSKKTMDWPMRLTVACYIAEVLEYCINVGQAHYYDLNPYKVLFDEAGNPCLSGFGLLKNRRDARCYNTNIAYTPPGCVTVNSKSMVFSFGILLRDLLSGEQILENKAIEVILGKKIHIVLDSRLKGEYSAEEATALVELAYQCLRYKPDDRPSINDVIAALAQVQNHAGGPSNAMAGTQKQS